MWAMSTLGFEDYIEPLKVYLAKYREVSKNTGHWPLHLNKVWERRQTCHL